MLPLPSPFPDSITQHIGAASSAILSALTSFGSRVFPDTTSLIISFFERFPQAKLITWTATSASQFATVGPYDVDWPGQQYKCWISQWVTFGLIAALQSINIFWLYLILRILWRIAVSFGEEVEDDRSEYSDEEEEAEQRKAELDQMRKKQGEKVAGAADDGHMQSVPEGKLQVLLNGEPVSPIANGHAVSGKEHRKG
jgi:hypothetical protein